MGVENVNVGLVRPHRWADIETQEKRLRKAGCGQIIDLKGRSREDIIRLARDKRPLCLVYAFLLVELGKATPMGAFLATLAGIEKRDSYIMDLSTGLVSNAPEQRPALLAVVKDQIRRSQQGKRSAANGRLNKPGRQLVKHSPEQLRVAKAIWRDRIEYPRWEDADAALDQIRTSKDEPFTRAKAHRLWGPRTRKR